MKLKNRIISISLLLNPLLTTIASEASVDCNRILHASQQRPEALPISNQSFRIEGEQQIAGTVLKREEKILPLGDAAYLYLIDEDDTVVYSLRVDLGNPKDPLVSHRALYEKLKSVKGVAPQIVAAGEFDIHQNRVSLINNKSGTWRGKASNLEWAEKILIRHGLAIETETSRIDLSSVQIALKHHSELEGARTLIRIDQNPLFRGLMEKFRRIERVIAQNYPSSIPGKIDWDAFFESTEHKVSRSRGLTQDQILSDPKWATLFQTLYKSDDFTEFPIQFIGWIEDFGYTEADEALDNLVHFEGFFGR